MEYGFDKANCIEESEKGCSDLDVNYVSNVNKTTISFDGFYQEELDNDAYQSIVKFQNERDNSALLVFPRDYTIKEFMQVFDITEID